MGIRIEIQWSNWSVACDLDQVAILLEEPNMYFLPSVSKMFMSVPFEFSPATPSEFISAFSYAVSVLLRDGEFHGVIQADKLNDAMALYLRKIGYHINIGRTRREVIDELNRSMEQS